jgi:hypothetical protein
MARRVVAVAAVVVVTVVVLVAVVARGRYGGGSGRSEMPAVTAAPLAAVVEEPTAAALALAAPPGGSDPHQGHRHPAHTHGQLYRRRRRAAAPADDADDAMHGHVHADDDASAGVHRDRAERADEQQALLDRSHFTWSLDAVWAQVAREDALVLGPPLLSITSLRGSNLSSLGRPTEAPLLPTSVRIQDEASTYRAWRAAEAGLPPGLGVCGGGRGKPVC